jgi:hypothetical protein
MNLELLPKNKKLDLEGIRERTKDIAEKINSLKKRIEILEGKHDFLDYCHSELGARNQKIKKDLILLLDKEKILENLFFYVIQNFFPNLKIIENDNSLPDKNNINQEKIFDISKNEIISQIYKKIQNYYLINGQNLNNIENFMSESSKNKISKLVQLIAEKNRNAEAQNELNYFKQIKDFQEKYLSDLDENLNAAKNFNLNQIDKNENEYLRKKTERDLSNSSNNSIDKNKSVDSDGLKDLM